MAPDAQEQEQQAHKPLQPEPQQQQQQQEQEQEQPQQSHSCTPHAGGKKRKVALFLGYVGEGYQGMQRNPGCRTIEGDLERALHRAGAISDENAGSFGKIHWSRAARTDKGVSAACQVVSCKLMLLPEGLVTRINAQLPRQITAYGYFRYLNIVSRMHTQTQRDTETDVQYRTIEGFDARVYADKRKYEYILPVWMFDPNFTGGYKHKEALYNRSKNGAGGKENLAMGKDCMPASIKHQSEDFSPQAAASLEGAQVNGTVVDGNDDASEVSKRGKGRQLDDHEAAASTVLAFPAARGQCASDGSEAATSTSHEAHSLHAAIDEEIAASTYKFTEGERRRLNGLLSKFVGTHNFHNFTVGVSPETRQAVRYIMTFECCDPVTIHDTTWVKLVVVGQSFVLHQIRKMIGFSVAVMRGLAPPAAIDLALDGERDVPTPMAPDIGLMLDEVYFEAYNRGWQHLHEPLNFDKFRRAALAFKENTIYAHVFNKDQREYVNASWLRLAFVQPSCRSMIADIMTLPKVRSLKPSNNNKQAKRAPLEKHCKNKHQSKMIAKVARIDKGVDPCLKKVRPSIPVVTERQEPTISTKSSEVSLEDQEAINNLYDEMEWN